MQHVTSNNTTQIFNMLRFCAKEQCHGQKAVLTLLYSYFMLVILILAMRSVNKSFQSQKALKSLVKTMQVSAAL
jgi:hypothetical protein